MNKLITILSCLTLLNGCAFDVVHVKKIPTYLQQADISDRSFELLEQVSVNLGTFYNSTLKAKTKWDYMGTIPYGAVFKSREEILTVKNDKIYEAYIVVSSGKLVGFYLPLENSFSPLNDPVVLKRRQIKG